MILYCVEKREVQIAPQPNVEKCEIQIAPKPSHWELLVTFEAIKAMRIAIAEDKPLRCPLLNHLSLVHEVPAVAVGVRLVRPAASCRFAAQQ